MSEIELPIPNETVCVSWNDWNNDIVNFYRSMVEFRAGSMTFDRRVELWFADNDLHVFKAWGEQAA